MDSIRSYIGSFTWGPLVCLSRAAVLSVLSRVKTGHILIVDSDGSETICGERWAREGAPMTELKVLKGTFWVRLMLFADMVRPVKGTIRKGLNMGSDRRCCRDSRRVSCWVR